MSAEYGTPEPTSPQSTQRDLLRIREREQNERHRTAALAAAGAARAGVGFRVSLGGGQVPTFDPQVFTEYLRAAEKYLKEGVR